MSTSSKRLPPTGRAPKLSETQRTLARAFVAAETQTAKLVKAFAQWQKASDELLAAEKRESDAQRDLFD